MAETGAFTARDTPPDRARRLNLLRRRVGVLEALGGGARPVLPMVDGSVPPVFIVQSDGSLVYTEI